MRRWLLAAALVTLSAQSAYAQISQSIPEILQEKTNWCWAAVSRSMLQAYGVASTQTDIANFGTPGSPNIPNWLSGETFNPHQRGIDQVLNHFGQLQTTHQTAALDFSQCQNYANTGYPFVIGYQWQGGGGHALIGEHCDYWSQSITVMDPAFGLHRILSFPLMVSEPGVGSWTETLLVSGPPEPPVTPPVTPPLVRPEAPQLQAVFAGICDVQVYWSRPAVGSTFTDFIYRRESGGQWTLVHSANGGNPGNTFVTLRDQPCSTPNGTPLEYRMQTRKQYGSSASYSPYTAPIPVLLFAMVDVNAHPAMELKVVNVPAGLHISWGPHAWTKTVIERRAANGSWAPLKEVHGEAQRTGFTDFTAPENQQHFYRYRAVTDSFGVLKYSPWSNEKSGTSHGTRGGMIVSDANGGLAVNAYGGAKHLGILKLVNNCTATNTDCTWTYRNGMLLSDTNPNLAINAYGGASHLGMLRLVNNCTPTNPDCTWTLKDGMFVSDRNPTLAINAVDGAIHEANLKLVNYCTPASAACTFTYRDVSIRSNGDEGLMMNAYGGAMAGASLKLVNNCTIGHPDCTWSISRGLILSKGAPLLAVSVNSTGGAVSPLTLSNTCTTGTARCKFTLSQGLVISDLPGMTVNAYGGATHGAELKGVNNCIVLGGTPASCKFLATP